MFRPTLFTVSQNLSRPRLAAITVAGASLLALGLLGCVPDKGPKDDMGTTTDLAMTPPDMSISRPDLSGGAPDLAAPRDMAVIKEDMAGGRDLSAPADLSTPPDLSMPPADMASGGPRVTGLPTCAITGVTADTVFNDVAKLGCANGRCHATGAAGLTFTSGATLKSAMVGVASKQTSAVPLVTASDVDKSYLMYKLVNQQGTVMGSGGLMPKGGAILPDADLCKFIVWIKEGAK